MNYECFKHEMLNRLKEFLPEQYQNWDLSVSSVNKVNGREDAVFLISDRFETAYPTLYVSRFFEMTLHGLSAEQAIRQAAEVFLDGMRQLEQISPSLNLKNPEKQIFYMLINTEKNVHLLKNVPHREMIDLSLIYRIMMDQEVCGFSSTVVTEELAERFGFSEDRLYHLAEENTPRLLPPEVFSADSLFFMIGNQKRTLGAAAVLYTGLLEQAADAAGKDLYVIPSSIHEMLAVPAMGQDLGELKALVKYGNCHWVKPEEILSGEIYYYSRKEKRLKEAAETENCLH